MPKVVPLTARLPEDLHAALVERAALDARSLNGELIFLLREALFPLVEADAYQLTRQSVSSQPRHTMPLPVSGRRRSK